MSENEHRISAKMSVEVTERINHITDNLGLKLTHVLSALLMYSDDEKIIELTQRYRRETGEKKELLKSLAKLSPEHLDRLMKDLK